MFRGLVLVVFVGALAGVISGQELGVLHIKVTLTDPARGPLPLRHALLISDNPATTAPRRVVTANDGTATVRLRPGNYTVESDEPIAFGGRGYQWTQDVNILAGRDVTLELTSANAEVVAARAGAQDNDSSLLLPQWQDSVVGIWTPAARASGFIVDAAGLVVTNQRLVGSAATVDVQFTPSIKVAARVLVADRARDVAVLWVDPATAASIRPVPLDCADASKPPFAERQRVLAIGAPLRGPKEWAPGDVIRVEPKAVVTDLRLATGSLGGPVFNTAGVAVGLSSLVDGQDERTSSGARVVPAADVCEGVRSAAKAMQSAQRPLAAHLPVEPLQAFPADVLDAATKRTPTDVALYQLSSSDFDVTFLTPVMIHVAQHNPRQGYTRGQPAAQAVPSPAADFGNWSEYFADVPPVLAIRVTPRLAESFWTTIARGAAYTQGVALPPIRHFKPGFSQMRVMCGDADVAPIHPFTLEQRVSETDAIREGLYVFDPQVLGPHCKSVKLVLYSEKEPRKPDTRPVDPQLIERVWQDFAPHRAIVAR